MENKIIRLANLNKRPASKSLDAEAERLLDGFRRLSQKEKQTLLTLLDAFLLCRDQTAKVGLEQIKRQ